MSIPNNTTGYITPSTTFTSTTFNSMVLLSFDLIDASERPPYAFLAFGTFISFLITLYIFYNDQTPDTSRTPRTPRSPRSQHKYAASISAMAIENNDNIPKKKNGEKSVPITPEPDNSANDDANHPIDDESVEADQFMVPNKDKVPEESVEIQMENQNNDNIPKKRNGEKSVPPTPEPDNSVNDNADFQIDDNFDETEETNQGYMSCCCSCLKTFYRKNAKAIKWIVVIYQVASLVYTFAYTWRLASKRAPDKGSVSWNNYQVFAKAFAISSHCKSVITTAFVLVSKKYILKQLEGTKGLNAKYDSSVMVYLFCFAISCAFYGVTFFWTHLLPGIVIFCPLVLLGAAGFGIFLGIIYFMGQQYADNDDWKRDWIIWIGGLLCTITACVCVIVMEAMVMYWDKPDLETWMHAVIIVFTQRDSEAFMDGMSTKTEKLINLIAMLL